MSSGDSTISTVIQWELEYAISHDYDIVSDRPETVVDFSAPPPLLPSLRLQLFADSRYRFPLLSGFLYLFLSYITPGQTFSVKIRATVTLYGFSVKLSFLPTGSLQVIRKKKVANYISIRCYAEQRALTVDGAGRRRGDSTTMLYRSFTPDTSNEGNYFARPPDHRDIEMAWVSSRNIFSPSLRNSCSPRRFFTGDLESARVYLDCVL